MENINVNTLFLNRLDYPRGIEINDTNFDDNENKIIDMGHHNIRYATMIIYLFININLCILKILK